MNIIKHRLNQKHLPINQIKSKITFTSTFKWGSNLKTDVEEFNKQAKKTVDYIVNKHKNMENLQISPISHKENDLKATIQDKIPDEPTDYEKVLHNIDTNIISNYTFYNHPKFLAETSINSYPAIIGNLISDAFNNPGVSWVSNPAGFELERLVLEWMAKEFGLSSKFLSMEGGCCVHLEHGESGAVAALAARTKKRLMKEEGFDFSKMVYYFSSECNRGGRKSGYIANGVLREVDVVYNKSTCNYEMDYGKLEDLIRKDIENGLVPCMIYSSLGTVSTSGYDNIEELSRIALSYNIWHHVDASILGNALLLKENPYIKGLDKVNSIVIDGNKALPFGLDSSFFYVDEAKYVFKALNEDFVLYVQFFQNNQSEMTNYHFGTARATKSIRLWMVIKAFGIEGLRQILRKHLSLCVVMEKYISESKEFEVFTKPNLNMITFRLRSKGNEDVEDYVDYVNSTGKMLISKGVVVLNKEKEKKEIVYGRICFNDIYMNESSIKEIFELMVKCYKEKF